MISVVLPLFNKEQTVKKTIESVLKQSFKEFELIVIDDGSTDQSFEIVNSFNDERIKLFKKNNGGVSSTRNYGIKASNSSYIAFIDGDDWWHEDFLKTLFNLKDEFSDCGLYCCQYVQVDKHKNEIYLDRFPDIEQGYINLKRNLYAVWSSSILVKKEVFDFCGYFNEKLTHGEDTEMWLRIGLKYKIFYTSQVLSYYNIASNPLTRSVGKKLIFEKHIVSVIDKLYTKDDNEWNSLIYSKKIAYLNEFYKQDPFNKIIKTEIDHIISNNENGLNNSVLSKKPYKVYFLHTIPRQIRVFFFKLYYSALLAIHKLSK